MSQDRPSPEPNGGDGEQEQSAFGAAEGYSQLPEPQTAKRTYEFRNQSRTVDGLSRRTDSTLSGRQEAHDDIEQFEAKLRQDAERQRARSRVGTHQAQAEIEAEPEPQAAEPEATQPEIAEPAPEAPPQEAPTEEQPVPSAEPDQPEPPEEPPTLRYHGRPSKEERRAEAVARGGVRGYLAGVLKRGDVFGRNRQPRIEREEGATGAARFIPRPRLETDAGLERVEVRQQTQRWNQELESQKELDETSLQKLVDEMMADPEHSDWGTIDRAIVAMAARWGGKWRRVEPGSFTALDRALDAWGMSQHRSLPEIEDTIYRANDFIVGQNYAELAARNPAVAMTREPGPGKEYERLARVPDYKRKADRDYELDADGNRVLLQGARYAKVSSEGSFFPSQLKEASTEKLLTGLDGDGADELTYALIQLTDGRTVSAMDYILETHPNLLESARDTRIYSNISEAVKRRIQLHGREGLYHERLLRRTLHPGLADKPDAELDEMIKAGDKGYLWDAAHFAERQPKS